MTPRLLAFLIGLPVIVYARQASAQDVGHKVLGSIGLDAGSQPAAGLYVADRFVYYRARSLRDRDGDVVPIGLDIDAYASALGLAWAIEVLPGLYFDTALAVPLVAISVSTDDPRAHVALFGLADMALEPVKFGWRLPHLDLITSLTLFAPTRTFGEAPVGKGQWSEEISLGMTVFFTNERSWRYSVLASYDLYQQKRGAADVTRGDTLSVQGGIGGTLARIVDAGAIGYAHWQLRDHRGRDLPPILRETRDRVFGLGIELGAAIPPMRSKVTVRWAHDIGAHSRPEGQVLFVSVSSVLVRPPR